MRAVDLASDYLRAFRAGVRRAEEAAETVRAAMREAVAEERNVLFFDRYVKWKPTYFAEGGQTHPTQYALFPGPKGKDWRVVTIPVELGSREDKRKLPESWGGLEGAALEEVTGVPGSVFCHRNRFIASFTSCASRSSSSPVQGKGKGGGGMSGEKERGSCVVSGCEKGLAV